MARLVVPRHLADETQALLRGPGDRGFEALVLWAGRGSIEDRGEIRIELVLMPRQHAVRRDDGVAVIVDGNALFEMNVMLNERGLRLLAQVHSHPGTAYHSDTDDRYSVVTARGGLSIVVPNFAEGSFSLESCALYQLVAGGAWSEVSMDAIATVISIDEEG